ncbi:pyridoxal phosphate-dependent transferase [Catenaria anguillulae PL171]|uniref:Pyridoxal phosphate-dependent transferase n=1 Tax=Catenaria anguillulae PL171 TaxID=765915 RepID=A0A1Y2I066_9FUNG|nr:pyridoxal phosphate-dependent transferase [Catenaria anguillulae PL171]
MEAGGIPAHTGATVLAVPVEKDFALGLRAEPYLTAKDVEQAFVPDDGNVHNTPTRLVCLENTLGGAIMPVDAVRAVREVTTRLNVPLHMDGARLWNACAELGVEPRVYAELVDSVSVCLSKGIGAPVGSVLVGSELLIRKARHLRKMYGGAWRQAGLLAAAARHALDEVYPKGLVRSHDMARQLAEGLKGVGAAIANPGGKVETNMVFVDWAPLGWTCEVVAKAFAEEARENPDQPPIRLADDAAERVVGVVRRLKERQEKAKREGLAN